MKRRFIYGLAGFGDSVYLYSIARYLLERGDEVTVNVHKNWRDLFDPLKNKHGDNLEFEFLKELKDVDPDKYEIHDCNYWSRKGETDTNQFQDMLICGNLPDDIPLTVDFDIARIDIDVSKDICLLRPPNYPSSYSELIPAQQKFERIIDQFDYYYISLEKDCIGQIPNVDVRLYDTSMAELLTLATRSSIALCRCGFLLPVCEALGKPVFCLLSSRGRRSKEFAVKTIIPKKVKCGESSLCLWDDDPDLLNKFKEFANASIREC